MPVQNCFFFTKTQAYSANDIQPIPHALTTSVAGLIEGIVDDNNYTNRITKESKIKFTGFIVYT